METDAHQLAPSNQALFVLEVRSRPSTRDTLSVVMGSELEMKIVMTATQIQTMVAAPIAILSRLALAEQEEPLHIRILVLQSEVIPERFLGLKLVKTATLQMMMAAARHELSKPATHEAEELLQSLTSDYRYEGMD